MRECALEPGPRGPLIYQRWATHAHYFHHVDVQGAGVIADLFRRAKVPAEQIR